MIIPDVNILLYAHETVSIHHNSAHSWWTSVLEGNEVVGIPWVVISAFYRITSLKEYRLDVVPRETIIAAIGRWLVNDSVIVLNPKESFFDLFSQILVRCQVSGKLTSDAFLAALAIENGATLASNDKDFSRFESEGLRWFNPLESEQTHAKKRRK